MAIGTGTPTTTTSGLQTSLDKYYDALLISTLDPMTRFVQFGQRRPLPRNSGDVVVWNRGLRLGLGYSLSEGNPVSAVKQISTTNVSATIQQFGDVVNISDLVQLTGVVNARKLATERLAAQAAETLDQVVKMAVLDQPGGTAVNGTVTHYIKGSTSAYFANSADVTATASDPRLQVSDIRKIVFKLRSLNVPTFDGQNYIGIIHPNAVEDIIGDSKWENFHQKGGLIVKAILKNFSKFRESLSETTLSQAVNGRCNDYESIKISNLWNDVGRCIYRA